VTKIHQLLREEPTRHASMGGKKKSGERTHLGSEKKKKKG